jgi:hypothetical protein
LIDKPGMVRGAGVRWAAKVASHATRGAVLAMVSHPGQLVDRVVKMFCRWQEPRKEALPALFVVTKCLNFVCIKNPCIVWGASL